MDVVYSNNRECCIQVSGTVQGKRLDSLRRIKACLVGEGCIILETVRLVTDKQIASVFAFHFVRMNSKRLIRHDQHLKTMQCAASLTLQ